MRNYHYYTPIFSHEYPHLDCYHYHDNTLFFFGMDVLILVLPDFLRWGYIFIIDYSNSNNYTTKFKNENITNILLLLFCKTKQAMKKMQFLFKKFSREIFLHQYWDTLSTSTEKNVCDTKTRRRLFLVENIIYFGFCMIWAAMLKLSEFIQDRN